MQYASETDLNWMGNLCMFLSDEIREKTVLKLVIYWQFWEFHSEKL